MKKALTLLLIVILFASSAYAAQWVGPLTLQHSWDRKESGFCPGPGMCLVSASPDANEDFNGMPEKYFSDEYPLFGVSPLLSEMRDIQGLICPYNPG